MVALTLRLSSFSVASQVQQLFFRMSLGGNFVPPRTVVGGACSSASQLRCTCLHGPCGGIATVFMLGGFAGAAALLCCDCPHAPWWPCRVLACVLCRSSSHFLSSASSPLGAPRLLTCTGSVLPWDSFAFFKRSIQFSWCSQVTDHVQPLSAM